jgi:adenylate kinase family enzyme
MRIAVVGTSGCGKTTLAKRLAAALRVPCVELDALHWDPGWQALSLTDPDEFVRRVRDAVAAESWVVDGNYGLTREMVWGRATDLIWLDYDRPLIMYRVITRSVARALDQRELWAGNTENWRTWIRPSHPIRWAWSTWRRRRLEFAELLGQPEFSHLRVWRLRQPREATRLVDELARTQTCS